MLGVAVGDQSGAQNSLAHSDLRRQPARSGTLQLVGHQMPAPPLLFLAAENSSTG